MTPRSLQFSGSLRRVDTSMAQPSTTVSIVVGVVIGILSAALVQLLICAHH